MNRVRVVIIKRILYNNKKYRGNVIYYDNCF